MKKQINDYEMIYLIKRKSEIAYEILYQRYTKYVYAKLKKFSFSIQQKDDIAQECLFEITVAIFRFNEFYNILFSSYVDLIIERRFVKELIKYYKEKTVVETCLEIAKRNLKEDSIEYNYIEAIDCEIVFKSFIINLTYFEQVVLKEILINNISKKEFCVKYQVNEKRIYNTSQSIRKKFIKFIKIKKSL